jgi:hypothetical protein
MVHSVACASFHQRRHSLQEGVALTSDRANVINIIYINKFMLKVFRIRKLMQSADVNILDSDNQLYLIFYLYQRFIISDKINAIFNVITICFLKQILVFCRKIKITLRTDDVVV